MQTKTQWFQFSLRGLLLLVVLAALGLWIWPKLFAKYALAHLSNDDIRITHTFVEVRLDFSTQNAHAQKLLDLGAHARPYLIAALADPDRFVAAHVLLTHSTIQTVETEGGWWNHLEYRGIDFPDVQFPADQMPRLQEYWQRQFQVAACPQTLNLGDHVTDDMIRDLVQQGSLPIHLEAHGWQLTNDSLAILGQADVPYGMSTLNLDHTAITDAGLKHFAAKPFQWLYSLSLQHTNITPKGLVACQNLLELRELNLTGTGVTDADVAYLARLPKIHELHLSNTGVTDAIVDSLKTSKLKRVYLRNTKFSPQAVDFLEDLRPDIHVLHDSTE